MRVRIPSAPPIGFIMNEQIQKDLDLLQQIMQDALLKALIELGDEAKELSWFCKPDDVLH